VREFDRAIGAAWRRLRLQRFLSSLVWAWAGLLLLVAVAIGVEKLGRFNVPGPAWLPFAVAGGVGLVVAALVALFTGPSRLEAAVAIDHAFGLNERISTALTLPAELQGSPAGHALMEDARRHVERLDIGSRFGLKAPRRAWLPLLPAALALGLMFVPEWAQRTARATSRTAQAAEKKAVSAQAKALSKTIAQARKEMEKPEFAETMKLLAEIEKKADELARTPPAEKGQALVELNKLTDALKERQQQLGSAQQVGKQLQQLKDLASTGPADDFAKELARADFAKAAEELKKIQEKLTSGQMSDAEKKALQEQVNQMKEQLQQMANLEQRKKQLEEAARSGALSPQQLQQEMKKLEQQAQNLQQMKKLAEQLGQCQQAMQQGDLNKAAQALGMSQEELQQLAQQASELQTLDDAMADLQDAKAGMSGEGMNQLGEALEGMGLGMGKGQGNGQNGLGKGRGQGDRPEAPDDVSFHNTKTQQQYGKGKAVVTGFAPPRGVTKGESVLEIQGELEASGTAAAEALSNQRVPNNVKKHVLGYFDQIRKAE
jgi:hypothetical protein